MLGADGRAVTAQAAQPAQKRHAGHATLACLALAMLASGAPSGTPWVSSATAAEWIIGGSVSQRLEADTNPDLREDGDAAFGAITALGLDIALLTPTTQWQIETGASGGFYIGSDETDDLNQLNPNFAAAVSRNGKYVDTGASFAFDMQPVAFAQIEDTGITEGDATQVSVRIAANAAYAIDRRNRLSLGGSGRVIRFTDGATTLEPTTSYGANLAWIRDLSPATQASLTFGGSRFTAESDDDPESLSFDLSAGVGHLVNRRLSFDASLGVSATRTTRTRTGVAGAERETELNVGAIGGLEAAWAAAPDTQLVFALSHGLQPSSLGELQTTTALGVGLQHAVNNWTSADVDVLVQQQRSAGGFENDTDRTFASIAPSLAFSLTPDWALRAGYALALEREEPSDAVSNQVFLTLTRQFDILR